MEAWMLASRILDRRETLVCGNPWMACCALMKITQCGDQRAKWETQSSKRVPSG